MKGRLMLEKKIPKSIYMFLHEVDLHRVSIGWSRSDLAARVGVTDGRISKIFNCPGNISLKTLEKLAKAVGMRARVGLFPGVDND